MSDTKANVLCLHTVAGLRYKSWLVQGNYIVGIDFN